MLPITISPRGKGRAGDDGEEGMDHSCRARCTMLLGFGRRRARCAPRPRGTIQQLTRFGSKLGANSLNAENFPAPRLRRWICREQAENLAELVSRTKCPSRVQHTIDAILSARNGRGRFTLSG